MAFPATAEVEGYSAEKRKGNIVVLDGGRSWRVDMRLGLLTAPETEAAIRDIEAARKP
jgi:hypothetical protein